MKWGIVNSQLLCLNIIPQEKNKQKRKVETKNTIEKYTTLNIEALNPNPSTTYTNP